MEEIKKKIEKTEEMLCKGWDEILGKSELTAPNLELLNEITDGFVKLYKIKRGMAMEEEYSYNDGYHHGGGSYRGGNSYGEHYDGNSNRGSSYGDSSYRDGYSREEAKDRMYNEMMQRSQERRG